MGLIMSALDRLMSGQLGGASTMARTHRRQAVISVVVNGADISALVNERLVSLEITDEAGIVADGFELTLDDRDFAIAIPPTSATLSIALGYVGEALLPMGVYSVDEVEPSGCANKITLRGKSADMSASMKSQRKQSWHKTTLGKVLSEIAARNQLKEAVAEEFKKIALDHLDQSYESDIALLTRLAEQYGAVGKPSGGYLVFVKRGASLKPTGEPLPVIDVVLSDDGFSSWSCSEQERNYYGSVRAFWHDKRNPKKDNSVTVGKAEPLKLIKTPFKDEATAKAAAQAELERSALGRYSLNVTMIGNPLIVAESTLNVTGIKPECCGEWVVTSVRHSVPGAYTTSFTACRKSDFVREEMERKEQEREEKQKEATKKSGQRTKSATATKK